MRRRALNVVTGLSLLLCVGLSALWIFSFWSYDAVGFWPSPPNQRAYGFVSTAGTFAFIAVSEGDGVRRWGFVHRPRGSDRLVGRAGFLLRHDRRGSIIGVPHPLVSLLLAVPPAYAFWRRARRRADGLCPHCGYDLRATPRRCPECGRPGPERRPGCLFEI